MQGVLPNHGLPLGWGGEKGAASSQHLRKASLTLGLPMHRHTHTPSCKMQIWLRQRKLSAALTWPILFGLFESAHTGTSWGLLFKTLLLETTLLWQTKDSKSAELNTAPRRQKSRCQYVSSHVFPTFSWKHQYLECTSQTCRSPGLTCPSIKDRQGQGDGPSPSNPQGYHRQCSLGSWPCCVPIHVSLDTTPAGQRNHPGRRTAPKAACVPHQHCQTLPVLTSAAGSGEHRELTNWEQQGREASADGHRAGRREKHTWLQRLTLLAWLRAPPFSINPVCTWISVTR